MKQFFINNNSDKLLIFFAGWGCDEHEFAHLKSDSDVLIFYFYTDFDYDFDFSKYSDIYMISFSAGVFAGSLFKHDFKIIRKIALSGNPYLFDEKFGLSSEIQKLLYNLTEDDCVDFTINYLVKTDEEYKNFLPSKRSIESCRVEFDALKILYNQEYDNIKDVYDMAIVGEDDPIFNVKYQKEFYGVRCRIIPNARHNLFFRIKNYNEILNFH